MNADWRHAHHARRMRERRLPRGLRDDVQRIRAEDLADMIIDIIFDAVVEQAEPTDFVYVGDNLEFDSRRVLLPVVERRILRRLNENQAFRGRIRREVNEALRNNHLIKLNPGGNILLPSLGRPPVQEGGFLRLRSSIGLGTASLLESEPEEWNVWVLAELLKACRVEAVEDIDQSFDADRPRLRILALGAGAGGLARVATALQTSVRVEIQERDDVLEVATDLPSVVGPRDEPADDEYDAVTVVFPAPGMAGGFSARRVYNGEGREDLGRLGVRRWLQEAGDRLVVAASVLAPNGRMYVLLPAGCRDLGGYRRTPELLQAILDRLGETPLRVLERLKVVEVDPVSQPFVHTNRPDRWSLTLGVPVEGAADVA